MVAAGTLGMGHAKALISASDALDLAQRVITEGLSVRQVESLVRKAGRARPSRERGSDGNADLADLQHRLGEALGMTVTLAAPNAPKGTMTIEFSTLDQLDLLCRLLEAH